MCIKRSNSPQYIGHSRIEKGTLTAKWVKKTILTLNGNASSRPYVRHWYELRNCYLPYTVGVVSVSSIGWWLWARSGCAYLSRVRLKPTPIRCHISSVGDLTSSWWCLTFDYPFDNQTPFLIHLVIKTLVEVSDWIWKLGKINWMSFIEMK